MKKTDSIIIALIGWFALIAQYYLIIENSTTDLLETTVRYFSFFTILTNLLVVLYITRQCSNMPKSKIFGSGTLTALTAYITVVGITYQFLLRPLWSPTGLQRVVDELLHSVMPLLTIIYWYLHEPKLGIRYQQIYKWIWYPLFYLVYILIRGKISGYYPYPFVDVTKLGLSQVLINSLGLLVGFIVLSAIYIWVGKKLPLKSERGNIKS